MHQRPYERLIVWQEAHKLCLRVNIMIRKFPFCERDGLVDQMRRSAYSVPHNIAEGNTKRTPKGKLQYFNFAHSSLEELHSQLRLARDLHYISEQEYIETDDLINRVSYLLTRLQAAFRQSSVSSVSSVPSDSSMMQG